MAEKFVQLKFELPAGCTIRAEAPAVKGGSFKDFFGMRFEENFKSNVPMQVTIECTEDNYLRVLAVLQAVK